MAKSNENIVFMIGSKKNGSVFNPNVVEFTEEITFGCFYPSRFLANDDYAKIFGRDENLKVVETEIVEFKDGQLTISFEDFSENPPL